MTKKELIEALFDYAEDDRIFIKLSNNEYKEIEKVSNYELKSHYFGDIEGVAIE